MPAFWRTDGTYDSEENARRRAEKLRDGGNTVRIAKHGSKYEVQVGSDRTKNLRTKG